MTDEDTRQSNTELTDLCKTVRALIGQNKLKESEELIKQAMGKYPHAPQPHNLMGVKLENEGAHSAAMKHFRASWALDPAYFPARYNLYQYGELFGGPHKDAYDETDCPPLGRTDKSLL